MEIKNCSPEVSGFNGETGEITLEFSEEGFEEFKRLCKDSGFGEDYGAFVNSVLVKALEDEQKISSMLSQGDN